MKIQKGSASHFDCAVIGDWHLSSVTAACLAQLGHRVCLVNPLEHPDRAWKEYPRPPVHEPGLSEMITEAQAKDKLTFRNGVDASWTADFVWLAIDTPVNDRDEADTTPLERVARQVAQHDCARGPFIVSSQVPMGFGQELEKEHGLTAVYIPENLRLGKGIETFLTADRTVIGATLAATREKVKAFLSGLQTDFLLCDLVTAEMIKHATNAFLATSISFANQMARIGECMGADNQVVGRALKMDKRIGKGAYVIPGLGFAGGTLPRDLRILQKFGTRFNVPTPLVDAVLDLNDTTLQAIVSSLRASVGGSLRGRPVLLLGYTYKADTDTLRRSPSLEIAGLLRAEGAQVLGYDPQMNDHDLAPLAGRIEHCPDWARISAPDAVVLMTPRPGFQKLDWAKVRKAGALVLDAHSFLSADTVIAAGLAYKPLWQPVRS